MGKQALKVMVLAVVLVAFTSPAWANGLGIVFDPGPPSPPGGGTNLYYLETGGPYTVSWQTCAVEPSGPLPPSGPGSGFIGDPACLGFANYTGNQISTLTLQFTVGGALDGLTLSCSNTDSYLATNNCSSYSSPLTDGEMVTLVFTGPVNVPPVTDFFFAAVTTDSNGNPITIPDFSMPDSTLTVPAYDPSTLVLLTVGIAMLGMCGIRRYA